MNGTTTTNCHGTYQNNAGPSSGVNLGHDLQKDVLDTFHQFSNDEVLTPPWLVKQMLDMLPSEVWGNPDLKWLDIACKSGVFLREAAMRLKAEFTRRAAAGDPVVTSTGKKLVNEAQIVDHILGEMLYGVATTNLMAKVSRRVLYSSVDATHPTNSAARRVAHFNSDGNIRFVRASHHYNPHHSKKKTEKKITCTICGYSKEFEEDVRGKNKNAENYAYELIHPPKVTKTKSKSGTKKSGKTKTLFKDKKGNPVKFDVIIGNPPYQMADSSDSASAKPIYNKFIEVAKQLNPQYMTMIIPARWYAAGKGLDSFRAEMINDHRIAEIHDFPNASEVFPDNEIKGGVMYFLWDSERSAEEDERELCKWTTTRDGKTSVPRFIDLRTAKDVILRDELSFSILAKVQEVHGDGKWMNSEVSARKPFGLETSAKGHKNRAEGDVLLYQLNGQSFYAKDKLKNPEWADKHKALMAYAGGDGMKTLPNLVTGQPFKAGKGSACTETYLVCGLFDSEAEAERRVAYMKTRFFRYMVSLRKLTQHGTSKVFAFVPVMDNSKNWTDADLYKHFKLSEDEIAHIEATVKVMP